MSTIQWLPSDILNALSEEDKEEKDNSDSKTIYIESDEDSDNVKLHKPDEFKRSIVSSDDETPKRIKSDLLYQSSEADIQFKSKNVIFSDSEDDSENEDEIQLIGELSNNEDSFEVQLVESTPFTMTIDLTSSEPVVAPQQPTNDLKILELFNNGTKQQLSSYANYDIPSINNLLKNRPFDSLDILKYYLKSLKMSKALSSVEKMVILLSELDELLANVEQFGNHLSQLNLPLINDLPPNIKSHIKPYQLQGSSWMLNLFNQQIGGILGDEMGLGKSLQTILFISYLHDLGIKPTIIIVPLSTLNNWQREIDRWNPQLTYIVYHANKQERDLYDVAEFKENDIVLTTYQMATGQKEDRRFLKKCQPKCVILDEGHQVKNCATLKYKQLMQIPAKTKILLTGTPINNNLKEIISLLAFAVPDVFADYFEMLDKLLHCKQDAELKSRIDKAALLLKPFLLRRYKRDHMVDLPKKEIIKVFVELTPEQQNLYNSQSAQGKLEESNPSFLTQTLELRKICNHPLLVQNHYKDKINDLISCALKLGEYRKHSQQSLIDYFSSLNDYELHQLCLQKNVFKSLALDPKLLLLNSAKMNYLTKQLPKWIANGDKILIFSQFLLVLDLLHNLMEHLKIVLFFNLGLFIVGWVNCT